MELFTTQEFIHYVHIGDDTYLVMPRTSLKEDWRQPVDANEAVKEFVPYTPLELSLSAEEANVIVRMTIELDGQRVFRMWRDNGITVGGTMRNTIRQCADQWHLLRFKYVVVFWDKAADKLWELANGNVPNCLCNCLPLAISAACEHVQCARGILQEDYQLKCPGQNK